MRRYAFIALLLACLPFLGMGQSPLALNITGYNAKCNGSGNGSAKVTPSGGVTPYLYTWSPAAGATDSISGLTAGIYSVTVTDSNGNTVTGSITISQPAPLIVSIDSIVVPDCLRPTSGGACSCSNTLWAVVSGGTLPYSYSWSPGSGTGDTQANTCYMEFTVNVTDSNNCTGTDSISVVPPLRINTAGIGQVNNVNEINTYPNPAYNQLNISIGQSATGVSSLAVYDITGGKVFEQKLGGNEHLITIDVSGFSDGNYLLRIVSDASQKTTHFSILR